MSDRQPLPGLRRCIGFGEYEGICSHSATVHPALLWCLRCEEARRAHLDGQFAAINTLFELGGEQDS